MIKTPIMDNTMLSSNLIRTLLIITSISLALTACGGGGGSESKPETPPIAANVSPTIEDMPTQSVNERDSFSYSPSVADSDGSVVEYKWEQITGTTVTNGFVDSMSSLEFLAPEVLNDEVLTFKLTITDNDLATASKNVDVTIKAYTNLADINFSDAGVNECLHSNHYAEKDIGTIEIVCHGYSIESLVDIAEFNNLTHIDFTDNNVADLTPLTEKIELKTLWLPQNNVEDLSPLSELINLKKINIANNKVNDLTPLSALSKLEHFAAFNDSQSVNNNDIRDISPISGASNLNLLWLMDNRLESIEPIKNMTKLTTLTFGKLDPESIVDDLSPLTKLTNLKQLVIGNHKVTDLTPLAQLTNLNQLTIYNNKVTDLSPLAQLTQLTSLELLATNAIDGTPLSKLIKLEKLRIGGYTTFLDWYWAKLDDVSFLESLTSLKELSINLSEVSSVDSIANLTQLESFDYDRNKGLDLKPFSDLTKMKKIQISTRYGGVSDISPLINLTHLEVLSINDSAVENDRFVEINTFSDISVLADKTKLTFLALDGEIEDLTPIQGLLNLEVLGLSQNKIVEIEPILSLEKLTRLGLYGNDNIFCTDLELLEQTLQLQHFDKPDSCLAN